MVRMIEAPTIVKAAGTKDKIIRELFGLINSQDSRLSIAHMTSPEGWEEPGQCPEFNEYTYVLSGILKVETKDLTFEIETGQAVQTQQNEWVRYSTPYANGAEYIAVCLPAFSIDTVHRDD